MPPAPCPLPSAPASAPVPWSIQCCRESIRVSGHMGMRPALTGAILSLWSRPATYSPPGPNDPRGRTLRLIPALAIALLLWLFAAAPPGGRRADSVARGLRGPHRALRGADTGACRPCIVIGDPHDEEAWGFRARPAANALWKEPEVLYAGATGRGATRSERRSTPRARRAGGRSTFIGTEPRTELRHPSRSTPCASFSPVPGPLGAAVKPVTTTISRSPMGRAARTRHDGSACPATSGSRPPASATTTLDPGGRNRTAKSSGAIESIRRSSGAGRASRTSRPPRPPFGAGRPGTIMNASPSPCRAARRPKNLPRSSHHGGPPRHLVSARARYPNPAVNLDETQHSVSDHP